MNVLHLPHGDNFKFYLSAWHSVLCRIGDLDALSNSEAPCRVGRVAFKFRRFNGLDINFTPVWKYELWHRASLA